MSLPLLDRDERVILLRLAVWETLVDLGEPLTPRAQAIFDAHCDCYFRALELKARRTRANREQIIEFLMLDVAARIDAMAARG